MKLFRVQIEVEALVMAEDAYDALDFASQIVQDIYVDDFAFVSDWNGKRLPPGWGLDSLVYHDRRKDITVADAMAECGLREGSIAREAGGDGGSTPKAQEPGRLADAPKDCGHESCDCRSYCKKAQSETPAAGKES